MTILQDQIKLLLEHKGWTNIQPDMRNNETSVLWGFRDLQSKLEQCPDLTNSLDACKAVFEHDAKVEYWVELEMSTCDQTAYALGEWNELQMAVAMCKATCPQRIEAYLRSEGLLKN